VCVCVCVCVCFREYGDDWHKGGILERKQNVFDDFIAAAEYLVENKYTNSKRSVHRSCVHVCVCLSSLLSCVCCIAARLVLVFAG